MSFLRNPSIADHFFNLPSGYPRQPFYSIHPKAFNGFYNDDDDDDDDYYDYDYNNYNSRSGYRSDEPERFGFPIKIQNPSEQRSRMMQQQQQPTLRQLQQLRQEEALRRYRQHLEEQHRLEQQRLMEMKRDQQRIQEIKLQQQKMQELREQQRIQQEKLEQEKLRKRALILRFTHAAKVIQRAFRSHQLKKRSLQSEKASIIQRSFRKYLAQKRERSALIIQRSMKRMFEKKRAQEIRRKLENIKALRNELESLRKGCEEKVLSNPALDPESSKLNKNLLAYEDSLLKFMMKLDSISSGGSDIVRDARKSLVTQAQNLLLEIDHHKNQGI